MKLQIKLTSQYDINDADHPSRKKAISILERIQDELCPKCVRNTDKENWYALEDFITDIIEQ